MELLRRRRRWLLVPFDDRPGVDRRPGALDDAEPWLDPASERNAPDCRDRLAVTAVRVVAHGVVAHGVVAHGVLADDFVALDVLDHAAERFLHFVFLLVVVLLVFR
jgi:hypothetical protein